MIAQCAPSQCAEEKVFAQIRTSQGHEFENGHYTVVVQKWEQLMLLQVNYLNRRRRNLIYVLKNEFYRRTKGRRALWVMECSQQVKCLGNSKRHMEKREDRVTKWSVCQNREFELHPLGNGVPWDVLWREADLRKPVFEKDNHGMLERSVPGRRG